MATAIAPSLLRPPPHNSKTVLGEAGMAKTLVTVRNISSDPGGVAFKIKTTKPRRYLVRPNQSTLMPGERREVAILMSPEKQAEARQEHGQVVRDKFQVVYLSLNEAVYDGLKNAAEVKEQAEQLERLWEQQDKRAICKLTFEVEIALQEDASAQALGNVSSTSSTEKNGKPLPVPSSVGDLHSPGSVEPFYLTSNQMTEYRQRYDDLVTFTVALTSERDLLINALDSVKMQLRRELTSHADGGKLGPEGAMHFDLLSLHKRRRSPFALGALQEKHNPNSISSTSSTSRSKTGGGKVSHGTLLVLLLVAVYFGHKVRECFGLWWWFF